jgi:peptidylprolyl isomerase
MKIQQSYVIGAVVLVALLVIAYLAVGRGPVPVVAMGDNITVSYTGTFLNGTVFDSSVGKAPLQFIVGAGQMIPGFDHGVIGMSLNEEKTITIPANQAYGSVNPALYVSVPSNTFGNMTMQVGMVIRRSTNGLQQQGVVTAVNATNVTIDFNSALAGKTLVFKIKILSIKKG